MLAAWQPQPQPQPLSSPPRHGGRQGWMVDDQTWAAQRLANCSGPRVSHATAPNQSRVWRSGRTADRRKQRRPSVASWTAEQRMRRVLPAPCEACCCKHISKAKSVDAAHPTHPRSQGSEKASRALCASPRAHCILPSALCLPSARRPARCRQRTALSHSHRRTAA